MLRDKKNVTKPVKYIIRVKNHLDFHWEGWFDGMEIVHAEGGVTILAGEVRDQPALHGLMGKIRDLNLTLLSVQRVDFGEGN